jgi:hypothetical protein
MEIQYVLYGLLAVGVIISVVMISSTTHRVQTERLSIIRNKVESIGGIVETIEEVKRNECPMCDEYKDSELSYKFFRFNYSHDNTLKQGWAILSMKQNKFGPNGGTHTNWMWRF